MEGLEQIAFQIITAVGTARSCYIEAIQEAKKGNFEKAEQMIKDGEEAFSGGHDVHLQLLTREANGESAVSILIIHAEDQLMSAEGFHTIAQEFIDLYKKLGK
ncbi:MAG: PTS lactose/cellobiose transporter subunit IIA [Selenomonadaceae bacterium]|nr:PTS lactose/cellobiose transporter subunit IIA [Selenomonadaceae bacterium]